MMLLSLKAKHDYQSIRVEYNKYRLEELVQVIYSSLNLSFLTYR